MPGDTPKACPSCGANYRDLRWYVRDTWSGMIYRRVSAPIGGEGRRCPDEWHDGAPLAFDAALAALDYQPVDMRDTGQPVYEILGLDDVRAAHRAEVERAVAEERARCMADCDAVKERIPADAHDETAYAFRGGADACRAAIRARGAKS